jgi:hypothetical protein
MTVGEPITETFSTGSNILTQGYQQSRWTAVSIFELNENEINISAAPNPTKDFIYLYVDNYKNLKFQICDIYGKILKESTVYSDETMLTFSGLPSAVYVLNICQNTRLIKTFQIIKQ